jgi:hypothetical protein
MPESMTAPNASPAETKKCLFCAETLRPATIVCRYCGRNLIDALASAGASDRQLIEREVALLTARGWRVRSQTETTAQLAKPKWLNPVGMMLLVMLPTLLGCGALLIRPSFGIILMGIAGAGLVLLFLDYAMKKERVLFLSADRLRERATMPQTEAYEKIAQPVSIVRHHSFPSRHR